MARHDPVITDDLRLTCTPTVKTGMGIRRPVHEVFEAIVDPEITTRFWFTKSSRRLEPGATVHWDWEMYGASAEVRVKEVEEDRRIIMDWGDGEAFTTVQWRFARWGEHATYVEVTKTGLSGDGDQLAASAAGSTGGFTIALCALKALLEHGIVLTAVRDRFPAGVET